jgi:tRNA G10  N-methylase Trm11
LTRNPFELLTASLPEWFKVLKKGGVLVFAWNKHLMPKDKLITLLEDNGFDVLYESPYNEFEHRVDMSIKRDIIVAKKPEIKIHKLSGIIEFN